jgi:hypothetical protein
VVPSNRFDTVQYEARVDDTGRTLDEDCTYLVSGPMPRSRWWSISALALDDQPDAEAADDPRRGLMSGEVVLEPDQSFRIAVSRDLHSGNWLRPPAGGQFVLLMRLYTPAADVLRRPLSTDTPSIQRRACR